MSKIVMYIDYRIIFCKEKKNMYFCSYVVRYVNFLIIYLLNRDEKIKE